MFTGDPRSLSGSAVTPYKQEVTGSSPVPPTKKVAANRWFSNGTRRCGGRLPCDWASRLGIKRSLTSSSLPSERPPSDRTRRALDRDGPSGVRGDFVQGLGDDHRPLGLVVGAGEQ